MGRGISLFTRGRVSGEASNFIIRNVASKDGNGDGQKWGGDRNGEMTGGVSSSNRLGSLRKRRELPGEV